ncbi:MAG TPA: response regulator transcription factor [Acidimicrobiia bacterium]|nr:response regulator transcription factor [Acidimicrobiia bacterium]
MTHGTIVVVEDDAHISDLVDMLLRAEGFRVIQAAEGVTGLAAIERERPRLVILDVGLPDIDGLELMRRMRALPGALARTPAIMLTARDGEIDRVLGLEIGADDYVTKPFSNRELVARVKAMLRRAEPTPADKPDVVTIGRVDVDAARREARVDGVPVALATREFDLLQYLADNVGIALSRRQLLDGVWGADWYGDDRTVDVHVRQLRKKLGDDFPLSTVWGVGYRLG